MNENTPQSGTSRRIRALRWATVGLLVAVPLMWPVVDPFMLEDYPAQRALLFALVAALAINGTVQLVRSREA